MIRPTDLSAASDPSGSSAATGPSGGSAASGRSARRARSARSAGFGPAGSPAKIQRFRHEAGKDPSLALLRAVEAGARNEVPVLLADLDDRARRALLPELKRLREDGTVTSDTRRAAYLAAAGCHTGAVACATWLRRSFTYEQDPYLVSAVLVGRPAEFLTTVVERLAARTDMRRWDWQLLRTLADLAHHPLPLTEATGAQWQAEAYERHYTRCAHRPRQRRRGESAAPHPDLSTPCGGLLAALREDPLTPRMLPHLIDTPELTGQLVWAACQQGEHLVDTWHGTYAALAAEGVLDRAGLIASTLTVLLRGTWPLNGVRFCVALLRALDLTADERAARTADWTRIAADAPSVAAGYAQEVLRDLWDTGRLTTVQLAETARGVFFRTEKQLVRAQLSWVEAALRRDPKDTAPVLLPTLGDVFGHTDTALQQRALRLAGRHLRHAGPAARDDLAAAAVLLRPGLLATAADLFDAPELVPDRPGPGAPAPHRDTLPEPRTPAPLPPPPHSAEEFAAEFASVLTAELRQRVTSGPYEWALDGVVRLAHQDREALAKALEPVAQRHSGWLDGTNWRLYGGFGLLPLLAAVTGRIDASDLRRARRATEHKNCPHTRFSHPWRRRLAEITALIVTGPVPPLLLAAPSRDSGALDPDDLLHRLDTYRAEGADPAPADFDIALLRLRRPADPAVHATRARALGTPAGRRLADWLTTPPPPAPAPERTVLRIDDHQTRPLMTDAPSRPLAKALPALPGIGDGHRPGDRWCGCLHGSARHWISLHPDRPDTLAVHLLPLLASSAVYTDRNETGILLTLAEAPGPPGPALHLALAYGLSVRHTDDRLAVVDAVLTLAARDTLDAARLGADLAALLAQGAVKANRVADGLATLVSAGAPVTAWSIGAALLPPLLTADTPPPRGTGDLLAALAGGAEAGGARQEAPWLAGLAARRGSSRLITEARRLHEALTG
ncbi:DUF6493 family protein [Streptomyces sp. NPDC093252]|uniref:DUF7824 domain-containing protein n=1 Tax=Streptomyces sp. NPDC093252 TaxID=3154980 RepID=UPI00341B5DE7